MNILVTGGGTVAPIDDVRQITNRSTGRLSAMITEACLALGAEVWHVHAPNALLPYQREAVCDFQAEPEGELKRLFLLRKLWKANQKRLHLVGLEQGRVGEYATAVRGVLESRPIDVAFLAMAVSDYEPDPVPGKLRSDHETLTITCHRTPKVIRQVRDQSPDLYLVGFKLLSGSSPQGLALAAEDAGRATGADLTVANDQREIAAGRHALHLVRTGHDPVVVGPGDEMATDLVDRAFTWAREKMAARTPVPLDDDGPTAR